MSNDASPDAGTSHPRRKPIGARRQLRRPHIVPEELFRTVLVNERRRARRNARRSVVLLVAVDNQGRSESPSTWARIVEAVSAATRQTDTLGWYRWRVVIGVILADVRTFDDGNAREFETRIQQEIAKRLDVGMAGGFSLRLHIYPRDPLLVPEAHEERRIHYDPIKRGLDFVGSLTLMVGLSPILLLIAAFVKLGSRGPVLLGEVRVGQMMQPFTMLKFRTMREEANPEFDRGHDTWSIVPGCEAHDADNRDLGPTKDPRLTRIGRVLCKTRLDELPQLWNVLRGDMSLVGPRPSFPDELQRYKPWHQRRVVDAKPGITGLWQVTGRCDTSFDDMVRFDLRYARTYSLGTDIKILLATPRAFLCGKSAC